MLELFGHTIELTTDMQCVNSPEDHSKLVHEARQDWTARNNTIHVNDAYVLCTRCGKALSLTI